MEVSDIIPILFVAAIGIMLGAVILGSVSTSIGNSITDNETKHGFEAVDSAGATWMSLLGQIALPVIVLGGFVILILKLK